jgi:hypothetical protein
MHIGEWAKSMSPIKSEKGRGSVKRKKSVGDEHRNFND